MMISFEYRIFGCFTLTTDRACMPKLQPKEKSVQDAARLHEQLAQDGIFLSREDLTWRVSPEPFRLAREDVAFIRDLGQPLLSFYRALNKLYFESVKGRRPEWIARCLDRGKSEAVVDFGRMNRFKRDLPRVIRPDLIATDRGWMASELDSVPGGIGLTANMAARYEALGHSVIGGADGMTSGFARMIRDTAGDEAIASLAVVVSDESVSYRPEMRWLSDRLNETGLAAAMVEPSEVRFTEEGLRIRLNDREVPVSVLYRFFELFDLKNIPKSELILYAVKKGLVKMTPPPKAHLEEKLSYALFHHPVLADFWRSELGEDAFGRLSRLFPPTWIMDPRPVPPHAVIPGLSVDGRPLTDWRDLAGASQKEREVVLKPSGYSELAWGSRGVIVGHDLPQSEWKAAIDAALSSFAARPYVLQPFFHGKKYSVSYYDDQTREMKSMTGRARLSPYYFVYDGKAELGGILATVCPMEKKLIHGMTEAIMAPCAVR
jgi:hypothetical protein